MELTVEQLFDYLTGTLSPADRQAVEAALARSSNARAMLERLATTRSTVQADAAWSVPATALEHALALGTRIERRREPSFFERLSAAAKAIVADLTFDSRLEGALVGLRGGSGFALAYQAGEIEIDLECGTDDDETFAILGQLTVVGTRAFPQLEVYADRDSTEPVTRTAIDATGMFRLAVRPGTYLFRFVAADGGTPVDVRGIDIP
ncbi:MAG: hypothetical protein JNM94_18390 [Phycisphaerae bacterium]|nr:hypothetical protein [Phycisphaerae bacterium]